VQHVCTLLPTPSGINGVMLRLRLRNTLGFYNCFPAEDFLIRTPVPKFIPQTPDFVQPIKINPYEIGPFENPKLLISHEPIARITVPGPRSYVNRCWISNTINVRHEAYLILLVPDKWT